MARLGPDNSQFISINFNVLFAMMDGQPMMEHYKIHNSYKVIYGAIRGGHGAA